VIKKVQRFLKGNASFQLLISHPWLSSSLLLYFLFGSFIMGWWALAFRPISSPLTLSIETSQTLALKTSALLEELSPLQRDALQRALAGHFPSMLKFIDQWDQDAIMLANQGVPDIQRLSAESYLQAHVLGHLLRDSSSDSLRQLNCKMNLEWMYDDSGRLLRIEDHFQRFLPQTYIAASFLLAIAHPNEIIALPKGLRQLKQLYPADILAKVPADIDRIQSEKLYLKKPDLAFVAPYSHPPALEVLRNQNIGLYSIKYVDTIEEIQEALLKVGHASNHILEAQLLAIFMDACLISIDNRLRMLQAKADLSPASRRFLYLSYRQHYTLPTTKCLTGQLMARALQYCPHLCGTVPDNQQEWRIPFEQEQILQSAPDVLIVSSHIHPETILDPALQQTQAFKLKQIFYVDEAIQESPTQYIVLAYFDLFQALAATYCL
jgi:iron complex transport system substrate-binding protein